MSSRFYPEDIVQRAMRWGGQALEATRERSEVIPRTGRGYLDWLTGSRKYREQDDPLKVTEYDPLDVVDKRELAMRDLGLGGRGRQMINVLERS